MRVIIGTLAALMLLAGGVLLAIDLTDQPDVDPNPLSVAQSAALHKWAMPPSPWTRRHRAL